MTRLDEKQIIEIFQKKLGNKRFVSEDVEVFKKKSNNVVVAVDTIVESTDIPHKMNPTDIARKSVAACVSDFAAKGIKPKFAIMSIVLPKKYSKKQIVELATGFQKISKEYGIIILGGDTNQGKELSISIMLYGSTDKIVQRKGAKKQDLIFVTGQFGNASAGLQLLINNKKSGLKQFDKKIERAFCTPKPKLDFGVKIKKYMSSAMDSSDGLAKTLNEMAKQSNKRFVINNLPYEKKLEIFCKKNKISITNLVLFGGEEYEFVFTVSQKNQSKIFQIAKKLRVNIMEIGQVELGSGVVLGANNKDIPDIGWEHFQN